MANTGDRFVKETIKKAEGQGIMIYDYKIVKFVMAETAIEFKHKLLDLCKKDQGHVIKDYEIKEICQYLLNQCGDK